MYKNMNDLFNEFLVRSIKPNNAELIIEMRNMWKEYMGTPVLISSKLSTTAIELAKKFQAEDNGWISVDIGLPKTNASVLVYRDTKDFYIGFYHNNKWNLFGNENNSKYLEEKAKITHWMPLPVPPESL
jgi:hypothetical protein